MTKVKFEKHPEYNFTEIQKQYLKHANNQTQRPALQRIICQVMPAYVPGNIQGATGELGRVAQAISGHRDKTRTLINKYTLQFPGVDLELSMKATIQSGYGAIVLIINTNSVEKTRNILESSGIFKEIQSFTDYISPPFDIEVAKSIAKTCGLSVTKTSFEEDINNLISHGLGYLVDIPDGEKGFVINSHGQQADLEISEWDTGADHRERLRNHKKFAIRCGQCTEILHQTTEWFAPDIPTTGRMIKQYGVALEGLWDMDFGPADIGAALTCCGCTGFLLDPATGRIPESSLVPIEEKQ